MAIVDDVKKVLHNEYDIDYDYFVTVAQAYASSVGIQTTYTTEEADRSIVLITAHLITYSRMKDDVGSKTQGEYSDTKRISYDDGFKATSYGNMAMLLDTKKLIDPSSHSNNKIMIEVLG